MVLMLSGRGADEGDAGGFNGCGEGCVLAQEAVAGVDGIGTDGAGGVQNAVGDEVTLGGRSRPDQCTASSA